MRVQFIEAKPNGDFTLSDSSSYNLSNYGWKLSGANIPAAYLTGYLAGKKAIKAGIEDAILDLGLQSNTRGSRIYATLKGIIDAGVDVPASEDIFPEEDVLKGSHIEIAGNSIKEEDEDKFKKTFSKYTTNKVKIDGIPKLVDKVKKEIDGKF
jgi:large subunit ribosomal protein L18